MNLFHIAFGYCRIEADSLFAEAILNICMKYQFVYSDLSISEEKKISLTCTMLTARKLIAVCRVNKIPVSMIRKGGAPFFIYRFMRRKGLLLGTVLGVLIVLLSQKFIWEIRVTGNEILQDEEIFKELEACGLSVGARISSLDVSKTENRLLMNSEDISWISINIFGTVADVEIRETSKADESENSKIFAKPANLIASTDAQIEMLEVYTGNVCVAVGDVVSKGQLLVGGIYGSDTENYRYTRANGKVWGRTQRTIHIEVPLEYEEKVYSDKTYCQKILKFFGKEKIIFQNNRQVNTNYDIIKYSNNLNFFGLGDLPVGIRTEEYLPYSYVSSRYDGEMAMKLAFYRLKCQLEKDFGDAQLLSKTITTNLTENEFILDCTLVCIENIALQSEFEITFPLSEH